MKRAFSILLAICMTAVFPVCAEGEKSFRFSLENTENFQIIPNNTEISEENGMFCAVGTELPSFYLLPSEPLKVNNLNLTVRYKFKIESEGTPSYAAIRHYGMDSAMNTAMTMVRSPKSGQWYEGEYPLYKTTASTDRKMFEPGSEIKQLRFDVKNTTGKEVKVFLEYIEIICHEDDTLGETSGTEQIRKAEEQIKKAKPGQTVILPDGDYRNVSFTVSGSGTAEQPVTVRAQTPGKVRFSGLSSMVIDGTGVTVDGILFQDGWSARVITFSQDSRNCRLTNSGIINFNDKDKATDTRWVNINGKNNRVDHCFFRDKRTQGVLLEVLRRDEEGDNHQIDHNYFGFYEKGIANGAETIRIGTGNFAQSNSNTIISNNFFEKCDGEAEIISNKSQGNLFQNNTFFNSAGCLTLRMGKGNLVEGNLFAGGAAGLRVIDEDQTVRNNYFYRMSGRGIAVESGTDPNPAAYYPVKNVRIENNTFDYCTAAAEMNYGMTTPDMTVAYPRKYPPQGVFQKNLIFADDGKQAVNEIGTSCQINYLDNQQVGGEQNSVDGFLYQQIALLRNDTGFLYTDSAAVGADLSKLAETPLDPAYMMPEWIAEKIRKREAGFEASGVSFRQDSPFGNRDMIALAVGKSRAYRRGIVPVDASPLVTPVILQDKTMVPLRFISEAFGFSVEWDEGEQKVTLEKDGVCVECWIGIDRMIAGGKEISLLSAPVLVEERTFLPLRDVAEAIGKQVYWDDRGIILIGDDDSFLPEKEFFDLVIDYLGY